MIAVGRFGFILIVIEDEKGKFDVLSARRSGRRHAIDSNAAEKYSCSVLLSLLSILEALIKQKNLTPSDIGESRDDGTGSPSSQTAFPINRRFDGPKRTHVKG